MSIPKEADPDVNVPMIYVMLALEGISPEDAERLPFLGQAEIGMTRDLGAHRFEAEAIVAYAEALKSPDLEVIEAAQAKVDALADRDDDDLTEIGELLRALRANLGG